MMLLILDSRGAADAARTGVEACLRTVIPALFPFFFISGFLNGSLSGSGFIAKLFSSPKTSGTVILTGLLGGYPVGARLAAEQYRSGSISRTQGDRLLLFCSQAGPAFFFGIAAARLGGAKYGWILWGIQILSAFSVSAVNPAIHSPDRNLPAPSRPPADPMQSALKAMASVCGWIVLFHVVIHFLQRWFLWQCPQTLQILLCGLLELTNGCLLLGEISNPESRFLLAAIMLNFGGLCVMLQTYSLTQGLNFRCYIRGKCLQTAFSVLYASIYLGHFLCFVPLLILFLLRFLPQTRKKDSFSARIAV